MDAITSEIKTNYLTALAAKSEAAQAAYAAVAHEWYSNDPSRVAVARAARRAAAFAASEYRHAYAAWEKSERDEAIERGILAYPANM